MDSGGQTEHVSKCYANILADCNGSISREHYISESVLSILSGRNLNVRGFPWQQKGDQLTVTATGLAAKVLCEAHNTALSPLDTDAGKFFQTLYTCTRGGMQGLVSTEDLSFDFEGRILEYWMLKVVRGAIASGNYGGTNRLVPRSWVEVLFGRQEWPHDFTLYSDEKTEYTVPEHDHARFDFVRDNTNPDLLQGLRCTFMCYR